MCTATLSYKFSRRNWIINLKFQEHNHNLLFRVKSVAESKVMRDKKEFKKIRKEFDKILTNLKKGVIFTSSTKKASDY